MIKSFATNITLIVCTLCFMFLAGEFLIRILNLESDKIIRLDDCVGFKDISHIQAEGSSESGDRVAIVTNSAGYRDVEHSIDKPIGTYRILFLGDSFTEALQVDMESTFWRQLQKRFDAEGRRVEVLSMGVSSYGTNQELLTYECYGRKYKPDLVVLNFYNGNDPVDNYFRRDTYSPQFEIASGTLTLDNSYKERIAAQNARRNSLPWGPLYWIKDRSKLIQYLYDRIQVIEGSHELGQIINGVNQIFLKEYPQEWNSAWELTDALLKKLIADTKSDGVQLILVDIPGVEELEPERVTTPELYELSKPETHISTLSREASVPFLSLLPSLEAAHKVSPINWPHDAHWNIHGHTTVADALYTFLNQERLLPNSTSQ